MFKLTSNASASVRGNSPEELYKVTPTPGIEKIFREIDACRNKLLPSFEKYAQKDVKSFVDRNEQPDIEKKMRSDVWKLLRAAIEPKIKPGFLALGGSTVSKLATRNADLDLCYAIRCNNGKYEEDEVNDHVLARIYHALSESSFVRSAWKVRARVPILQVHLNYPYHNIEVDINCNCVAGIYNSHLLFYYAQLDQRFVQMNIILKEWGKVKDVIVPRHGKLNSYTVSLMIIHFLQCGVTPPVLPNLYALFPQYFDGTANVEELSYELRLDIPKISTNPRTVGELIYGFFDYYSRFDYDNWAISIKDGRIFNRSSQPDTDKQYLFFLEEAYDGLTVPKNLTRRHKLHEIVEKFKEFRHQILRDICHPFKAPRVNQSDDYECAQDEEGENGNRREQWTDLNERRGNGNIWEKTV